MTAKMTEKKAVLDMLEELYRAFKWQIDGYTEQANKWDSMTAEERSEEPYQEDWSKDAKEKLKVWAKIEEHLDKLV